MQCKEGVIKFSVDWHQERIPSLPWMPVINKVRAACWDRGWIGETPAGVGFGNISLRLPEPMHFLITATQTGAKRLLTRADYAIVTGYDIAGNTLKCKGLQRASSESLTHASLYEADDAIKAVIHIHDSELWQQYHNMLPTTPAGIGYGTPAMARAVQKLVVAHPEKVLVMGGHPGGLLAYGETLSVAFNRLLSL